MKNDELDVFLNEIVLTIFRTRKWSKGEMRELNYLLKHLKKVFEKHKWELDIEKKWTKECIDEVKENIIYLKQIKK